MVYASASYLIRKVGIPKNALFQKTARYKVQRVLMDGRAFFDIAGIAEIFPEYADTLRRLYEQTHIKPVFISVHNNIVQVEPVVFIRDEAV